VLCFAFVRVVFSGFFFLPLLQLLLLWGFGSFGLWAIVFWPSSSALFSCCNLFYISILYIKVVPSKF
jgi:hypothetical protein